MWTLNFGFIYKFFGKFVYVNVWNNKVTAQQLKNYEGLMFGTFNIDYNFNHCETDYNAMQIL